MPAGKEKIILMRRTMSTESTRRMRLLCTTQRDTGSQHRKYMTRMHCSSITCLHIWFSQNEYQGRSFAQKKGRVSPGMFFNQQWQEQQIKLCSQILVQHLTDGDFVCNASVEIRLQNLRACVDHSQACK